MLLQDKKKPCPLIERILLKLQEEVIPVQVAGDIQFLFNKIGPDTWNVVLINNKGVLKEPNESFEKRDFSYMAQVKISTPQGAEAREILAEDSLKETIVNGKKIISIAVPPGDIRIVEIRGIK